MDYRIVRQTFLDYFAKRGHRVVASSPVVPIEDPTLLFTNAGMNQFKDQLLGLTKENYNRAASVQKCIRAGGKHNDLDSVGKDGRHLTFFEMLGNWSFGDYYKREAIEFAWDLSLNGYKMDPNRIHVSVYKDDDEAYGIWKDLIGVPVKRIVRLGDLEKGDEENFWAMGPTGPCGPCTELYYDMGAKFSCGKPTCAVGCDCDRYFEYWNNVFMEFDRKEDGSYQPLAFKSVDTGLGLERLVAILNGKSSVFETEVFQPIIDTIRKAVGADVDPALLDVAGNVLADHVRSISVSLTDGAFFSNDGRGYVLRRILRRGVRYCRKIGINEPFIYKLVPKVVETIGDVYPELGIQLERVMREVRLEEERFLTTLDQGLDLFEKTLDELNKGTNFPGSMAFKLHDTFGFPVDLTEIMLAEKGVILDRNGFEKEMEAQRERGRKAMKFYDGQKDNEAGGVWQIDRDVKNLPPKFVGYAEIETKTKIQRYRKSKDNRFECVLERTPFYAESGGQVSDIGSIGIAGYGEFCVVDVYKETDGAYVHILDGQDFGPDERIFEAEVIAKIDLKLRENTARNHTATHLLHRVLRDVLGSHLYQAGSKVAPDYLRFDFNYNERLAGSTIAQIEEKVYEAILQNYEVTTFADLPIEEAKRRGAMALFGEKYGDKVRLVGIADFSKELCAGTHVQRTGNIGSFKIISEGSIASGIRRIEAMTGTGAHLWLKKKLDRFEGLVQRFDQEEEHIGEFFDKINQENRALRKHVERMNEEIFVYTLGEKIAACPDRKGIKIYHELVTIDDRKELLKRADLIRDRMKSGVIVLGAEQNGKVGIVVSVTKDLEDKHNAIDLMKTITAELGGSGGGKPHLAQGSIEKKERFGEISRLIDAQII